VLVVCTACLAASAASFAYLTDTSVHRPRDYYTFVPPAAGSSYGDAVFGTSIKRISDARSTADAAGGRGSLEFITNEYSTMSPFNSDGTRLILQHHSYFGLYDGEGRFLKNLPFEVSASAEPRWSRREPGVLYFVRGNELKRLDTGSGATSLVHAFREYGRIQGHGESDICFDGDHFVLAGDGRQVFVYEISSDRKGPVLDTGGRGFDSLYLTPDDNVTVTWLQSGSGRFNGIELFDRNMRFIRQVARAGGHMDVTRDADGSEVLVWANSADPQPVCNNGVVKVRLADGRQTCLVSLDWSLALHVSAPDGNGWAFVETYAPSDPDPGAGAWRPYTNEVFQVRLDGSEIRRLAHHRSRPSDTYYYTPRVATNRAGTRLVFSSNHGLQSILGLWRQYTDVYLMNVSGGSSPQPSPAPTPAPSPTPVPAPTPAPTAVSRYQQDAASVSYDGVWHPNSLSLHSDGAAVLSMEPGSRARFAFSGTSVSWIGYRDEWSGVANVFLDGVFRGKVDTHASPYQAQAVLFSATGLAPGSHTLTIEVTGTRSPLSRAAWVWIDAFDVGTAR
jgi:hypothetical protein